MPGEPPWDAPRPGPRLFDGDAPVEAIGEGLLARTLPKPAWTHEAHFAATVWLLLRRPDVAPERDLPEIIRAYNVATGGTNSDTAGYHETITQASLRAARAFLAGAEPGGGLAGTVNALLLSPLGEPGWLFAYWSRPCLLGVEARRRWVPPDLHSLPF